MKKVFVVMLIFILCQVFSTCFSVESGEETLIELQETGSGENALIQSQESTSGELFVDSGVEKEEDIGVLYDGEIYTPTKINMYKTKDLYRVKDNVLMEVPQGLSFIENVTKYNNCFSILYNGQVGYVDYDEVAFRSNGEKSKVEFDDTMLFMEGSFHSNDLMDYILLNTEYAWEYNTDMKEFGWVKTNINGTSGWIFTLNPIYLTDTSPEATRIREQFFESIQKEDDVRILAKKADALKEIQRMEELEAKKSEESEVNESGNTASPLNTEPFPEITPPVIEEQNPNLQNRNPINTEHSSQSKIIIGCAVTIVVLIIIIILLIRKNMWYRRRYRYSNIKH